MFYQVITAYLILLSFFWLSVKFVLSSHGFPVSFAWPHYRDFEYLHQLIRRETNPSRRARFRWLLFGLYSGAALFVLLPLALDLLLP